MRDKRTRTVPTAARFMAAVVIGTLLGASSAWANPYDVIHRTIPASACSPLDSVQAAKVRLHNGAWRFDGTNATTVSFYCPFPINAFPADLAQGFGTDLQFFRVWYRDSDGMGINARVTANLRYRNLAGAWLAVAGTFNSNVFNDMGFATKITASPHSFEMDALYSFYVTIYRANENELVEFHGIDFRDGTQPAG